jgi:hypothetical protein
MEMVAPTVRKSNRTLGLAAVIGLSLLASACGGSPSSKVAQVGTTSSTKNAGGSNSSRSGDPAAYSACMRSHSVPNFPDPDSKGRIKITSGVSSSGKKTGVDINSPQFERARKACDKLLPNGGRPTAAQQTHEQQQMLRFAHCMRSHGVPRFPDPKPGGTLSLGVKAGVNPNTPQFQTAQKVCQKLVPGGPIVSAPTGPPPTP